MQIKITEETNSFRAINRNRAAKPPMPMEQINGYRARGPGISPLVIQGVSMAYNYSIYHHIHKQP